MKLKTYTVTVPTTGYIVYEVKAKDEADARARIKSGKGEIGEEISGEEGDDDDWEFECEEEE